MLSKRRLSPWFLFGLLLVIGYVSLRIAGPFLDYVLVAFFLAYLTYPAYPWLCKWVRQQQVAAVLLLLLIAVAVVVPLGFLIAELAKEMQAIALAIGGQQSDEIIDRIRQAVADLTGREVADPANDPVLNSIESNAQELVTTIVADLFRALAAGVVGIFVMLYVMYYTYIDGQRLVQFMKDILPMQEAHRDLMFHEIGLVTKAVMYGQVLTALIQAIIGGIGFWIFGVPNVVFWSVLMFILALLPVIGPPLIWVPASAYLWFIQGDTFAGVGLAIYSAILVSTVDNIIRPKLIGARAHIHPVIVLLGVLGGIGVFGFSGLVLGPLVLSIFVTILGVYRKEFASKHDGYHD